MKNKKIITDVLQMLANLSNDEVFTPPDVVNKILDILPPEIWSNSNYKFLDPACKTGVFLREVAKRLNEGLKLQIPDEYERLDHIFKNQLYGIAITNLTALLSRRTLYYSKDASSPYSIVKFENNNGNIIFNDIFHKYNDKKSNCIFCGVSKKSFSERETKEQHAYEFIHTTNPKELFEMKFDVIIGNPPYQLNDGGGTGSSAKPIYNLFIENAKKLNPKYICMIIPSRWMTGGKGLDNFRESMINDHRIKYLYDFTDSKDCFNDVDIKGGVCYFLWDANYEGKCKIVHKDWYGSTESQRYLCEKNDTIFIRDLRLLEIKKSVENYRFKSMSSITSTRKPYGLEADVIKNNSKYGLDDFSNKPFSNCYTIVGLDDGNKRVNKYIKSYKLPKDNPNLYKYKVFISKAYGCGEIGECPSTPVLGTPVLGTPGDICTETFLEIGGFETELEASNCIKYIKTQFFRALVGIMKQTQNTTQETYKFVPIQDFTSSSDINWNNEISKIDEELYKKYNLTKSDIEFIELTVKKME